MSARPPPAHWAQSCFHFHFLGCPTWHCPEGTSVRRQADSIPLSGVRGSELRKLEPGVVAVFEGGVSSGAEMSALCLWVLPPVGRGCWVRARRESGSKG